MTIPDSEVLRYMPLIKFIAQKVWRNHSRHFDLEDLISEGIFGLYRAFAKFDSTKGSAFKTYAEIRIRGAILDKIRELSPASRSHQVKIEVGEAAPVILNSWENLSNSLPMASYEIDDTRPDVEQIQDMIRDVISDLPKRQRQCISAYYLQEIPMRKIGDQLGLAESTVCSHIHRGLKTLRRQLMAKGTCSDCQRPDQPLIKGLCQTRCYPKSRRLAKAKEVAETQNNPIKLTPPVERKEVVSKKVLSIDFTEYSQVYDQLVKEAKAEVRDPEKQVLWLLIKHFSTVPTASDESFNRQATQASKE